MFVLIVDNERVIRQAVKVAQRQLAEFGLEVLGAGSPEEAAILVGRHGREIAVMAVEGILGTRNAYDLVCAVRKDLGPDVPIIDMSADKFANLFLKEAGCSHQEPDKLKVPAVIRELIPVAA